MKNRTSNNKPNLVIAFEAGKLNDYPFNVPQYFSSYQDFCKLAQRYFSIFIVRGKKSYRGNGVFRTGYFFDGKKFVAYPHPIAAAIVYDKGNMDLNGGKDWSSINRAGLAKICRSKYRTYQVFKKDHKQTCFFNTRSECAACLRKIRGEQIVYKPNDGFEGRGVVVGSHQFVRKHITSYKNGIVQEFMDTSAGIPGLVISTHDLRVIIMNGKPVESFFRIPPHGSLIANVARGGRVVEIKLSQIPKSVHTILRRVDRVFRIFGPRIYAVDLGFENGKPHLFEINHMPGLPYASEPRYYWAFHRALLQTLRNAVQS